MKKMLKKVLMLTLCIALALSLVGSAFAADEVTDTTETSSAADAFSDVTAGAWYEPFVDRVYSEGLMVGMGDGSFGVKKNVIRGQLATIIYHIAGNPEFTGENTFTDVGDTYYTTPIAWAHSNGVVAGVGDGKFGPKNDIKRADLVVMLWNYAKFAGCDVSTDKTLEFTDADKIPGYAVDAVRWAVQNGIISGYDDNTFKPAKYATRAEIAAMITHFIDLPTTVDGTFDLETVCVDDGQPVAKVIVHLEKPVEATAEELKDAFTVTVKDLEINFYGWEFKGDLERTITDVAVSEDGKTVELTMAITGVEFPASLAMNSGFAGYGGWYEVKAVKEVGSLTTDMKFAFTESIIDPVVDKWGKVDIDTEAGTYAYRWFDPSEGYTKPEAGYPLVVWLHGAGETGEDNQIQITANRVTAWSLPETQDLFDGAYVIAPQSNSKVGGGWGWTPANVMKTIEAFIAKVGEENVDRNRIVIGGCSMGGMGTWSTIREYPDYFAAAFPTCGFVQLTEEDIENLMDLPIYMIHTVEDGTVNITGTLNPYDAMVAAGKTNVYLALYEHTWTIGQADSTPEDLVVLSYNGHSSWIYTHNDFDGEKEADKYFMDEYTHTFENEDGTTVERTYRNTKPSELGYKSFKDWLAGQSK